MSLTWSGPSTSSAPGCSAPRSAWPPSAPGSRSGSPTSTTSTSAPPAGSAPAGPAPAEGAAQLTVVAVPPDHIAEAVVEALERGGVVTDVGSVKGLPLAQVADHVERGPARPLRRQPPDGRQRALRSAGRDAPPCSTVGPWAITPARPLLARGDRPGRGARPAVRRRARAALAGGARPRGGPHLAPAAPARRAHRRAARRGPARAPLPVGPGRARRDPDRGRRPRHVGPDHPRQPGGGQRDPARRAGRPRAAGRRCSPAATRTPSSEILDPRRHRHPGHPRQARRAGDRDRLGVRLGARPPRRAGPAVRRRGGDRRQHRGPAHRPRPRPSGRPGRAGGARTQPPSGCAAALETREWVTHR